jgi:hypothetical protein
MVYHLSQAGQRQGLYAHARQLIADRRAFLARAQQEPAGEEAGQGVQRYHALTKELQLFTVLIRLSSTGVLHLQVERKMSL